MESKQKSVSSMKYYNEYSTFDISYIHVLYVSCVPEMHKNSRSTHLTHAKYSNKFIS